MIEVSGLTKDFDRVRALDAVSFRVERGSIFGLIGPNGAGKTTCLNILSTLVKPSAGVVTIAGRRIDEYVRETRRVLGYVPDFFGTYQQVTTWEYLDFYGGCCGVDQARRHRRIDEVLALVQLESKRTDLVDNLSRGMKQRLCLAKALLHEPQVLILDEPASGLDPRARVEIRDILKQVARLSVTVVISSHVLSELEQLCTHIGIIEQGKLQRWGEMATVLDAARPRKAWRLRLAGMTDAALARLRQVDGVLRVEVTAGECVIELDAERLRQRGQRLDAIPGEIVEVLVGAGIGIQSCTEDRASLEDAFLTFTQGLLA